MLVISSFFCFVYFVVMCLMRLAVLMFCWLVVVDYNFEVSVVFIV